MNFLESNWEIQTSRKMVAKNPQATEYQVRFICKKGALQKASVAIDIKDESWSEKTMSYFRRQSIMGTVLPGADLGTLPNYTISKTLVLTNP